MIVGTTKRIVYSMPKPHHKHGHRAKRAYRDASIDAGVGLFVKATIGIIKLIVPKSLR